MSVDGTRRELTLYEYNILYSFFLSISQLEADVRSE